MAVARRFVPPGLRVVQIWPGKTLAGLLFASYEGDSSLVYHELNVVAALVRAGPRVGLWLPRLFVDNLRSLAGGREIWGLPKATATFAARRRQKRRAVEVRDGERDLSRLDATEAGPRLPLSLPLPLFGGCEGALLFTVAHVRASVTFARARVRTSDEMVKALGLDRPACSVAFELRELKVPRPRKV